jgi:hypothetical protein
MIPKDNKLPATTYEAKQLICPLGLEVHKIHAYPKDYILYRRYMHVPTTYLPSRFRCIPVCGALRYKIRRDDPGEVHS